MYCTFRVLVQNNNTVDFTAYNIRYIFICKLFASKRQENNEESYLLR